MVNVDQPPVITPFAELLRSIEPQLRGRAFEEVWPMIFRSFNTELLPLRARQLVDMTCHPRQDIVLSYWSMVLQRPIEDHGDDR